MSRVRSPYWPIFFQNILFTWTEGLDIEFTPAVGFVLVTLAVKVLATVLVTALVTPMVTVSEYCDLNMKNFEFFYFFLILVFGDERPTVPFLELINDSFCC